MIARCEVRRVGDRARFTGERLTAMKPSPFTKPWGAHERAALGRRARDTTTLNGAVIRINLLSRDGRRGGEPCRCRQLSSSCWCF